MLKHAQSSLHERKTGGIHFLITRLNSDIFLIQGWSYIYGTNCTRLHSLYYFCAYRSVKYGWWKSSFCSLVIYILHISLMSMVISKSSTHIIFSPGENCWSGKKLFNCCLSASFLYTNMESFP